MNTLGTEALTAGTAQRVLQWWPERDSTEAIGRGHSALEGVSQHFNLDNVIIGGTKRRDCPVKVPKLC